MNSLNEVVEYTDWISAEGKTPLNECTIYDTKQSGGEAPVILELWEMRSTPSLPSLLVYSVPKLYDLIRSYQWVK